MYIKPVKLSKEDPQKSPFPAGKNGVISPEVRKSSVINSMEYLNKPRRLDEFKMAATEDDIRSRNTDMNRRPGRSKSLPYALKPILSKKTNREKKALPRSKCVHFDEIAPIRLYKLDDRPSVVSRENSFTGKINFDKVVPLRRLGHDFHKEDFIFASDSDSFSSSSSSSSSDDDDETSSDIDEESGFYNMNFSVLNYYDNIKNIKVNYHVNTLKNYMFLQNLELCCTPDTSNWFILGKIYVKNIYYNKLLKVRYTFDRWASFSDADGSYLRSAENTNDWKGFEPDNYNYEVWEFRIGNLMELINDTSVLNSVRNSINLEFCINYQTHDSSGHSLEYWDNNNDQNYKARIVVNSEAELQQRASRGRSRQKQKQKQSQKQRTKQKQAQKQKHGSSRETSFDNDSDELQSMFKDWSLSFKNGKGKKKKSIETLLRGSSFGDDSDSNDDYLSNDDDEWIFRRGNLDNFNFGLSSNFGDSNAKPKKKPTKKASKSGAKKSSSNFGGFNSQEILLTAGNQYPFDVQSNFKNPFAN